MKNIVVIYHADCWDGLGGAWAAWKKFGNKADYLGLKYGAGSNRIPAGLKNKQVYIIDFSFKKGKVMVGLVRENKKVIALDHHVSGEDSTKAAHEFVYDLKHSGAVIAWHYFHLQKPMPRLLKNIEDMDLWRFKLPYTKEIFAYLQLYDYKLSDLNKVVLEMENAHSQKKLIETGKQLLRYENKLIEKIAKNAELVEFGGNKVLAVNSTNFASELGHKLSKKHPPFAVIWNEAGGIIKVSLRSSGKFDVAKLAERYGGGGHKAAAGFAIPRNKKLPWKVIK